MALLVYCPTCGGKMSSNADRCPHCGECDFFRTVPTRSENVRNCPLCGGKGTVWAHTQSSGFNIDSLLHKGFKGGDQYVIGTFPECSNARIAFEIPSGYHRNMLHKCIRFKDYDIENYKGDYTIHFYEELCDKCHGEGKIKMIEEGFAQMDIRKPV